MRLNRILTAALSVSVIAGATLLAAPAASADQVWYQGVARASAEAACPTSSAADLRAGWSEWTPSWAQWANGGKGGYVCTRAITWAYEDTGGGDDTCVMVIPDGDEGSPVYVSFAAGWSINADTWINAYSNASCTDLWDLVPVDVNVVWAPGGPDQAESRCHLAFGEDTYAFHPPDIGASIFICLPEEEDH